MNKLRIYGYSDDVVQVTLEGQDSESIDIDCFDKKVELTFKYEKESVVVQLVYGFDGVWGITLHQTEEGAQTPLCFLWGPGEVSHSMELMIYTKAQTLAKCVTYKVI